MRVGVDVMGGDFAPEATLKGALLARKIMSDSDVIFLIGDQVVIRDFFKKENAVETGFEIVHTSEIIEMGDSPIKAFNKKPNSSISIGFKLLKEKKIDSFASAGNSGAMLVGSVYSVNTIPGVIRPTTSGIIPQESGGVSVLLDIGTNPDIRPDVMHQFGIIGSLYAQHVLNIKTPKVALLNIGEEEEKGNLLCQAAFNLMKDSEEINFIGNIESRDLFKSKADVIVCDGFTGNIVLKLIEAMYRLIAKRDMVDDYFNRFNYENYGGSPVLGINDTVLLGHGISNPTAIMNMILESKAVHEAKLPQKIKRSFKQFSQKQVDKSI